MYFVFCSDFLCKSMDKKLENKFLFVFVFQESSIFKICLVFGVILYRSSIR